MSLRSPDLQLFSSKSAAENEIVSSTNYCSTTVWFIGYNQPSGDTGRLDFRDKKKCSMIICVCCTALNFQRTL